MSDYTKIETECLQCEAEVVWEVSFDYESRTVNAERVYLRKCTCNWTPDELAAQQEWAEEEATDRHHAPEPDPDAAYDARFDR